MIKLICNTDSGTFDITSLVTKVVWSGDYKSCSRKLEFSLLHSAFDKNIPKFEIPLSSMIFFYEDDIELFRGFVWKEDVTNDSKDYLAYDMGERLNKIEVSYNIKNKTANNILSMVASDYGLNVGEVASASVPIKKVFIGVTIYDMLMTAYTEQAKKDNKKYMIHYKEDKLCATEKGKTKLKISFEEGKNIISSRFSSNIENMVNKVLIVEDNGNKKSEVKDDEMLKIHGLFQKVYKVEDGKDANTEAKAMLKGVERSCSLSGFGDNTCITGFGVEVKDTSTNLTGLFYIDSDTHTWEGGTYNIDLDLNFVNIMNEMSAGEDEKQDNTSSDASSTNSGNSSDNGSSSNGGASSSTNSTGDKLVDLAKSKLGCKYVWGATGPNTFDCSGLMLWCHKQMGISIPRTSLAQSRSGKSVSKSDLQVGDLVFFKTTSAPVGHVGIYVGNGQFIHAPNKNKPVKYDSLSSSYYSSRFVNARRYY